MSELGAFGAFLLLGVGAIVGYTLATTMLLPLAAGAVRAIIRPLARWSMDSATVKEVQWWHSQCRERAAELKARRRALDKGDEKVRWSPHDELLLACYDRLTNDTAELAELMVRPGPSAPPTAVS